MGVPSRPRVPAAAWAHFRVQQARVLLPSSASAARVVWGYSWLAERAVLVVDLSAGVMLDRSNTADTAQACTWCWRARPGVRCRRSSAAAVGPWRLLGERCRLLSVRSYATGHTCPSPTAGRAHLGCAPVGRLGLQSAEAGGLFLVSKGFCCLKGS